MENIKVIRKHHEEVISIRISDQISISLEGLGTFTATAHKVTEEGVLFIFDECVTVKPINEKDTNEGGYEASDLKKWIDTELINMFPAKLKNRITGLSIPSAGELFGHKDEWIEEFIEQDTDEQLPLMKKIENRAACYNNNYKSYWLKNVAKKKFSVSSFAFVYINGHANYYYASNFYGVRPEFWLKY